MGHRGEMGLEQGAASNWGDSLIGWTNKVRSDGQARVLVRVRDTVFTAAGNEGEGWE